MDINIIQSALSDRIISLVNGCAVVEIGLSDILPVIIALRNNAKMHCLMSITCVDYPGLPKRFVVIYNLLNMVDNLRILVRAAVDDCDVLPSMISEFQSAQWYEREIYDMYGLEFNNSQSNRRILMDDDFEGHPLRKDFPLTGYVEVRYDIESQKVVNVPVDLEQDYRVLDYESPWHGTSYKEKQT